jgi:hypothetical protein
MFSYHGWLFIFRNIKEYTSYLRRINKKNQIYSFENHCRGFDFFIHVNGVGFPHSTDKFQYSKRNEKDKTFSILLKLNSLISESSNSSSNINDGFNLILF